MTEREYLFRKLESIDPEIKAHSQDSLKNMGVKEMLILLRNYNAGRNRGELNDQFKEWIINHETIYAPKIADIYKVGNHKVRLAYYGIVYTILEWTGCYMLGKKSSPIGITRNKYCIKLNIKDRLSKNARKALANDFYAHNYFLRIESKKAKEYVTPVPPVLDNLESVFIELYNELKKNKFIY